MLFTAPDYVGPGPYDTYPFYDRAILFRKRGRGLNATTNGTATLTTTQTPGFDSGDVGSHITGVGIPAGTTITAVANAGSLTMSQAATGPGTTDIVTIVPPLSDQDSYGAMRTEVRVYPGGLGTQSHPNELF